MLACALLLAEGGRCAFDAADEYNVRIPRAPGGQPLSTEERLRLLELKVGSYMNWAKDPFVGFTAGAKCENITRLCTDGRGTQPWDAVLPKCEPGLFDHPICLDNHILPPLRREGAPKDGTDKPCLVYDFGVRAQPEFGMILAKQMGCEVHAFDPLPVSRKWYAQASKAGSIPPNYHFHHYGAGGKDGSVVLQEYGWGQVSILRLPSHYRNDSDVPKDDSKYKALCRYQNMPHKSFSLKARPMRAG